MCAFSLANSLQAGNCDTALSKRTDSQNRHLMAKAARLDELLARTSCSDNVNCTRSTAKRVVSTFVLGVLRHRYADTSRRVRAELQLEGSLPYIRVLLERRQPAELDTVPPVGMLVPQ